MYCEFKDDTIIFKNNKLICEISTKDEDDNIYRPKGCLSDFYENLKNKLQCQMDFDSGNKMMTISYPAYHYDLYGMENVKFEINGVMMIVSYDLCFEAICEFLKQFQFTM